jgi:hypothetical protein
MADVYRYSAESIMDNILKTVLAVIGISGLIAFIMSDMPSQIDPQNPAASGEAGAVTVQNAPAFEKSDALKEGPKEGSTDAPAYQKQEDNASVPQSEPMTVDTSTFGQPMMNPEPSIKFAEPQSTNKPKTNSVSDIDKPAPEQSGQGT